MAGVVNNLRVNNSEVKKILIKLREDIDFSSLKELYFNGILIWKNANPFVFTQKLTDIDLKNFGADTIIFEGFDAKDLEGNPQIVLGSYNIVEDAEVEKPNLTKGQMVVETTDGEKE